MDINIELLKYDVSRETLQKLKDFVSLLEMWNTRMNLVSKNSLADVWERHILDSMQLVQYISADTKRIVDIGSGSGFPGIVLAIWLQEKMPASEIFLVESIAKKTMYLNDVCARLGLNNVKILNERIENTVFKDVDIITARAVAALDILLSYSMHIGQTHTKMLFPKGQSYEIENSEAQKKWVYDLQVHPNRYHEDGVILEISKLRKKK